MDKSTLYHLSYGMYSLGVMDHDKPAGCIVNTVIQITSAEPIIAVSVSKNNYTCGVLQATGKFSVSILTEQTPSGVIAALGYRSARDGNKYDKLNFELADNLPILKEHCSGYLICSVVSMQEFSSHIVFFAQVTDAFKGEAFPNMTYEYYHKVIKGSAPKNAPTYQAPKQNTEAEEWVCDICGYVYKGDITKEPDDYVCPICGATKDHFVKKQS